MKTFSVKYFLDEFILVKIQSFAVLTVLIFFLPAATFENQLEMRII